MRVSGRGCPRWSCVAGVNWMGFAFTEKKKKRRCSSLVGRGSAALDGVARRLDGGEREEVVDREARLLERERRGRRCGREGRRRQHAGTAACGAREQREGRAARRGLAAAAGAAACAAAAAIEELGQRCDKRVWCCGGRLQCGRHGHGGHRVGQQDGWCEHCRGCWGRDGTGHRCRCSHWCGCRCKGRHGCRCRTVRGGEGGRCDHGGVADVLKDLAVRARVGLGGLVAVARVDRRGGRSEGRGAEGAEGAAAGADGRGRGHGHGVAAALACGRARVTVAAVVVVVLGSHGNRAGHAPVLGLVLCRTSTHKTVKNRKQEWWREKSCA